MNELSTALLVFACVLGAFGFGLLVNTRFRKRALSSDSKEAVKQMVGMLSTMTAVVLGLLVSSARDSFDAKSHGIAKMATDMIVLDRALTSYGAEAADIRTLLRQGTEQRVAALWTKDGVQRSNLTSLGIPQLAVETKLRELNPRNEMQRQLQLQALGISADLNRDFWVIQVEDGGTIQAPFLAVLVSWLIIIFASIGMLAPRSKSVFAAAVAASLALAGGVFLILELDTPYGGLIQVSDTPMHVALQHLGK
jgi:hypothetical protein